MSQQLKKITELPQAASTNGQGLIILAVESGQSVQLPLDFITRADKANTDALNGLTNWIDTHTSPDIEQLKRDVAALQAGGGGGTGGGSRIVVDFTTSPSGVVKCKDNTAGSMLMATVSLHYSATKNGEAAVMGNLVITHNGTPIDRALPATLQYGKNVFALTATVEGEQVSKTATVDYIGTRFCGAHTKGALTADDIDQLPDKGASTAAGMDITIESATPFYLWFCAPQEVEVKGIKSGGYEVPITETDLIYKGMAYKTYRSDKFIKEGTHYFSIY